jgi:AcrR family transcriptional regulator
MPRAARQTGSTTTRRRYAPRMAPAQRREQLLDAALEVVLEQGYARVSIEAIARTAGVTRPVIYDHFPNLGSLIQALIAREERYALSQLAEVVPDLSNHPEVDLATLLRVGLPHFFEAVAHRPSSWRIILLPLDGTPEIVREHVEANRAWVLGRIQDVVRSAVETGQLPARLDIEVTARAIMGLAWDAGGMIVTDPENHGPDRYTAFVRLLADQLLSATR